MKTNNTILLDQLAAELARSITHITCPNCGDKAIKTANHTACIQGHLYGELAGELLQSMDSKSKAIAVLVAVTFNQQIRFIH